MATSRDMSQRLHKMFADRLVEKRYFAVTKGVPDNREGIIDIPIEEGVINGKERMVLRPEVQEELRRYQAPSRHAKNAKTYFKVVQTCRNTALLEVVPETGVKHQIRVHLGFGLRCPVLGDHKYTYLDKLAPQRLPVDMLVALNCRQSKVRNIPMLLHARTLTIPEIGRNRSPIILRAPFPAHFRSIAGMLHLPL